VTLGVAAPQVPTQSKKENAAFVAEEVRRDRFVTVPLLADAIAGGSPRRVNADDIEDYALIHADWCPHPEHVTCVRVRGDSMSPILTDGSIVAIDHSRRNPKQLDGKMVAFRQGDGASVKWCKVVSKDLVMGLPENKDSLAADSLLLFQGDDIDDCVIGCVLWWWGRRRVKNMGKVTLGFDPRSKIQISQNLIRTLPRSGRSPRYTAAADSKMSARKTYGS
jgi:hypothetical protein